jgi:hypothetical protein
MATYGTAVYNGTSYTLYGRPGSTLIDELNRLANGGNYPAYTSYLDAQGAANKWAGTVGKAIPAALNYKVSSTRQPPAYKELNAVASELAGITDPAKFLEIVTALRTIAS